MSDQALATQKRAGMKSLVCVLCLIFALPAWSQKGVFLSAEDFQRQAFADQESSLQVLWLTRELRAQTESILGHSFGGLRVRYWTGGGRTAWVFEEIGKELPITVGVVVDNNGIAQLSILEYRESRGGEVRYPFFTEQFLRLGLVKTSGKPKLDGQIDGITGATLSVRAVKKVATLALLFHDKTLRTVSLEK